jgi:hypothetical protein
MVRIIREEASRLQGRPGWAALDARSRARVTRELERLGATAARLDHAIRADDRGLAATVASEAGAIGESIQSLGPAAALSSSSNS